MLKTNKTRTVARTSGNTLKDDDKTKSKKAALADKSIDKKTLTRKSEKKSDGLSIKSSVNTKSVLIKTKSSPSVGNSKSNEKPTSKKNVMNTVHNVTVASPPSSASKERSASTPDIKEEPTSKSRNHSRSRTRTIDPKDSFLHQKKLFAVQVKEPVKDPVAFEINFDEAKSANPPEDDEYNYESDFESYESDFEPEVPSTSTSSEKLNESADDLEVVEPSRIDKAMTIDKEHVDSGSYEMPTTKKPLSPPSTHYDSIDDTINSHDSGISYDDLNNKQVSKTQEIYKRGEELMKKITFDEISFDIFEAKPIEYESFMALYGGQLNTFQASSQTDSMKAVDEVQTEPVIKNEIWTQHPARFTTAGLEVVNSKLYNEEKLGVGEAVNDDQEVSSLDEPEPFSQNIQAINNFSKLEKVTSTKPLTLNTAQLHKFIENAAITITNVIECHSKQQELNPSKISISRGFMQLQFNAVEILHDTQVRRLYTNSNICNFLITVHKRKNSLQNILCIWDVISMKRPLKIFNSWCDVNCIEMHHQEQDVILGGCDDGTICLWDVQEFTEWQDEGDKASVIKPCEIISLNQSSNDFSLDNVVALKSLPYREFKSKGMFSQSQASQICSLHQNGTIVIWTISKTQSEAVDGAGKPYVDYIHLKSRVKLIRNVIIDLNNSLKTPEKENPRRKSAFEKTRYYFENDLFNDKVLRELQEIDTNRNKIKSVIGDELMKFNGCSAGLNEIFVASDLNFILAVSRITLSGKTRKIVTNGSSFISPSAIAIHPVNSNILAVGQANGEVKLIKVHDDENVLSRNLTRNGRKLNEASNLNDILAKSCAFQNIVEKEKKFYNETQAMNNLERDELKAFLVNEAWSEQFFETNSTRDNFKVPLEKNIFNSFEVSQGTVNSIEFNKSGEFMFVLVGKRLRIFNCWTNSEVDQQEKRSISDVKCVHGSNSSEFLILLTTDNEILVNKLKH